MKMNLWLLFGMMLSTSLLAQQVTNAPAAGAIETPAATTAAPAVPDLSGVSAAAPVKTDAPAAKQGKKKSSKAGKKKPSTEKKTAVAAKKPAPGADLRTVPLVAGTAVVVASNVNVRGQAKLKSEVVTRLTKGQEVTVLEEMTLKNSAPDEPSAWAKIVLPAAAHVWVNTAYIDPATKTVKPKKLNFRSGPGENYSVLGLLHSGDAVKDIGTKGDWTELEAPTNAYAFVAAQYLKQEAPAVVATQPVEPTTPATPTTVPEAPTVAAAPTEAPSTITPPTETPAVTNAPAETAAVTTVPVATAPASEPSAVEEPPPPRIVQREGIVRGTASIQAPTRFELVSPDSGKPINYLFTTSRDLDLRRYKGIRIIVTGEEALDERWHNTPVITIQKIQVLE